MSQNPNLFLSVGKPVKDEYGRVVGKVASFAMTPNGKFDAVFVEFSGGQFSKQPMEQMKFNGSEFTFISTAKSHSSVLCDQIPLIWRKDQALKDLSEKKKISTEMYMEIHNSFDGVLNQLKKDAQVLSEEISDEIATCDDEIRAMSVDLKHELPEPPVVVYVKEIGKAGI